MTTSREELLAKEAKEIVETPLAEGIGILVNLAESIKKHGNYSPQSTLNFIGQALACFRSNAQSLPPERAALADELERLRKNHREAEPLSIRLAHAVLADFFFGNIEGIITALRAAPPASNAELPVCCYCDHALSCAQCGMEQPGSAPAAMKTALEEIANRASNLADDDAAEWMPSIYSIAVKALGDDPAPFLKATGFDGEPKTWPSRAPPTSSGEVREEVKVAIRKYVSAMTDFPNLGTLQGVDHAADAILALKSPSTSGEVRAARAKLAPGPWKIEPHRDNPYDCHIVDANGQNVLVNSGRAFAKWIIAAEAALKSSPSVAQEAVAWRWRYKGGRDTWQYCSTEFTPPSEALAEQLFLASSVAVQPVGDEEHPDCATARECELYDALMGLTSAVTVRQGWSNWVQGGVQIAPIVHKALRLHSSPVSSTTRAIDKEALAGPNYMDEITGAPLTNQSSEGGE